MAAFYVNIADPPLIVGIDANYPSGIRETFEIPSKGPHGLDLDARARQLFCACDEGKLVAVHLDTGEARLIGDLSGTPDVVSFNRPLKRVYVAVGLQEWLTSLTPRACGSSKPFRRRREPTRSLSTIARTWSTSSYLPPTERWCTKTTDLLEL